MANPKQPVDLLLIKGNKNLTKNEINQRRSQEVKAKSDNIEPPDYLPDNIAEKFIKVSNELVDLDIMSNLDCDALARYLVAEYQFQKCAKKAMKMSPENPKYYNLVILQEKMFKLARGAASDLGLTISSRCKLVVPKQEEKPPSKFEKLKK